MGWQVGCVVSSCTGQDDFTRCSVTTTPDHRIDICLDGVCISPASGNPLHNINRPTFHIPDTGQRSCYDLTTVVSCPGVPSSPACQTTSFCGQDAQYGWDTTHAASERSSRTVPIAGEPVVNDLVTGLVWQGCAAGLNGDLVSCTGAAITATWSGAFDVCDELDWGGYQDWRLPSEYELSTLLVYDGVNPGVDAAVLPDLPVDLPYWSASTVASRDVDAIYVPLASPGLKSYEAKIHVYHVLCVRAGVSLPPPRFVRTVPVIDQPVVEDLHSGHMWQGCTNGQVGDLTTCHGIESSGLWQTLLKICEGSTWGGYSDWRLPDFIELTNFLTNRPGVSTIFPYTYPSTSTPDNLASSTSDPFAPTKVLLGTDGIGVPSIEYPKTPISAGWTCVRGGP
jgi:hypothetical protein